MQTSYGFLPNRAVPGLLAGMNIARISSFVNPTDAVIMGQFVSRVGTTIACQFPATSGDVMLGVALRDLTAVPDIGATLDKFAAKSVVPVLHEGEVWVACEQAVAIGNTPHIVYAGKSQVQTITYSADLSADNVATVTVNGSSVSETYASSHDATMVLLVAKVAALGGVLTATCPGSGSRVITVTSDIDVALTITSTVTGGSAVTAVIAQTVVALPSTNKGKLRTDTDSSRALDASAYVRILEYDSTTTLARVMVRILA